MLSILYFWIKNLKQCTKAVPKSWNMFSDDALHLCTHTLHLCRPSVFSVCSSHLSWRQRNGERPHLHGSSFKTGHAKYKYDPQQWRRLVIQITSTSAFIGWQAENPKLLSETKHKSSDCITGFDFTISSGNIYLHPARFGSCGFCTVRWPKK